MSATVISLDQHRQREATRFSPDEHEGDLEAELLQARMQVARLEESLRAALSDIYLLHERAGNAERRLAELGATVRSTN